MKSEFLSTAARTRARRSIYGYTELLRLREFSAEQRRDPPPTISRQSERMSAIINDCWTWPGSSTRQGLPRIEHVLQDIVATARPSPASSPLKAASGPCPAPDPAIT